MNEFLKRIQKNLSLRKEIPSCIFIDKQVALEIKKELYSTEPMKSIFGIPIVIIRELKSPTGKKVDWLMCGDKYQ